MTDEFAYAGLPKHVELIRRSDLADGPACFEDGRKAHSILAAGFRTGQELKIEYWQSIS